MTEELQLPPDTLDKLREGSEGLKKLDTFLEKARIAGLDTSQYLKQTADLKTRLRKTRDAFFPGETL